MLLCFTWDEWKTGKETGTRAIVNNIGLARLTADECVLSFWEARKVRNGYGSVFQYLS